MNDFTYRLKRFLYQEFIPVTKAIAFGTGAIFLFGFIFQVLFRPYTLDAFMQLFPGNILSMPWTILTFPLAHNDFLGIIFGILWLWMIGGSLERSWGSKRYGLFVLLATLATGVVMGVVSFLGVGSPIGGYWLLLLGITWAWAEIAPDQEVQIWGIIPVKARWLAWIEAAITFFVYFERGGLFFGLASLSGIAVVYLFIGKNPFMRGYGYGDWNRGYARQKSNRARRTKFRVIK